METIEAQRNLFEEIDWMEQIAAQELSANMSKTREKLCCEHFVSQLLDMIKERSQRLVLLYQDSNLADEVHNLETGLCMDEFYARIELIDRNETLTLPFKKEIESMRHRIHSIDMKAKFSGEECMGTCLDLHQHHQIYVGLLGSRSMDYYSFLDQIDKFEDIRKDHNHVRYLNQIIEYVEGFIRRAKPLFHLDQMSKQITSQFEELWDKKQVEGWFGTNNELFCMDCGKQFEKETVFKAHFSGKKHIQNQASNMVQSRRSIAFKEFWIQQIFGHLAETRLQTKINVERRQSLTWEERVRDDTSSEDSDDFPESEDRLYNPLNLPLGWDGKPIPYWLYKLHGLGVKYPCEICGNYVYMGRKAFDKHFQEWRHSRGMKCLGIPNTRHFYGVTSIQDARALWSKMNSSNTGFRPDTMEEFEDAQGNVLNRKVLQDLHRQGLL